MINLANINKFLVAIVGVAGVILSNGLVPAQYSKWVTGGIAVVSALSVYLVKNGPTAKTLINDTVQKILSQGNTSGPLPVKAADVSKAN